MHEAATPVEVSLIDLILVLAEITEDEHEIFATVHHMVEGGTVRLTPSIGARIPEAC